MKKQLFLALVAIGFISANMQGASSDKDFTKANPGFAGILKKKEALQAFTTYLIFAAVDAKNQHERTEHEDAPPMLNVMAGAFKNISGFTKAWDEFNTYAPSTARYDDYFKFVIDRYARAYQALDKNFHKDLTYYGTDKELPASLE